MELRVSDRSGAYSSEQFNLCHTQDILIRTLTGYATMNDEEVGFNPFIKLDDDGPHVAFRAADGAEVKRFHLEDEPIAAPPYLVGPGTTCYPAKALDPGSRGCLVKFAWREEERHVEREFLELTKERGVWGVIELLSWQELESIDGLRQGLHFVRQYPLKPSDAKAGADFDDDGNTALIGSGEGHDQPFVNRTLSCVVTSPLGRPINDFGSIMEFIEACRDIGKALRSLYRDGNILHRDIAVKSLIVVPDGKEDARGVLIDLDMALDLEKGPGRRGELIGSEGFMAIGILTGAQHTYRHDLESLFYVFLWIVICNDHEHNDAESLKHLPETTRLRGWCSSDFRSVARNKTEDMSPDGFLRIVNEFSEDSKHLKGLAQDLRDLLFPVRNGELFTGTDTGCNALYEGMILAFDRWLEGEKAHTGF